MEVPMLFDNIAPKNLKEVKDFLATPKTMRKLVEVEKKFPKLLTTEQIKVLLTEESQRRLAKKNNDETTDRVSSQQKESKKSEADREREELKKKMTDGGFFGDPIPESTFENLDKEPEPKSQKIKPTMTPDDHKETMRSQYVKNATKASNSSLAKDGAEKGGKIIERDELMIPLMNLPPQFWDLLSKDDETVKKYKEDTMKKKNSQPGSDTNNRKSKENPSVVQFTKNFDVMLDLQKKFRKGKMTATDLKFMTMGNLITYSEYFRFKAYAMASFLMDACIHLGQDRVSLQVFHNQNLYKVLKFDNAKELCLRRWGKLMKLVGEFSNDKQAVLDIEWKNVKDGTSIEKIDPLVHNPRHWATFPSPRLLLKCSNTRESKEAQVDVLNFVFSVERGLCDKMSVILQGNPTLKKYENDKPTVWWSAVMEAYQRMNKVIRAIKQANDGESDKQRDVDNWDDIEILEGDLDKDVFSGYM